MQSQVIILFALLTMGSQCSRPTQYMMERNLIPKAVLNLETESIESPNQFKAEVRIYNYGENQLVVNTWLHTVSCFVLEVVDSSGQTMPHLPPPVPDVAAIQAAAKTLKAGQSQVFELNGLAIDAGFMPPGSYRVRFKGSFESKKGGERSVVILLSEWKGLTVGK